MIPETDASKNPPTEESLREIDLENQLRQAKASLAAEQRRACEDEERIRYLENRNARFEAILPYAVLFLVLALLSFGASRVFAFGDTARANATREALSYARLHFPNPASVRVYCSDSTPLPTGTGRFECNNVGGSGTLTCEMTGAGGERRIACCDDDPPRVNNGCEEVPISTLVAPPNNSISHWRP